MNKKHRLVAVLMFAVFVGAACAPSPLFVRDSAYGESDMKFLVSDGSTQYIVKCDWQEVGGELENCRKLDVSFQKDAAPGGTQ